MRTIAVPQVPQFGTAAGTNFTDARWKGARGIETLLHCMTTLPGPARSLLAGPFSGCALRWMVQRRDGHCARVCSVDRGLSYDA